MHTIFPNIQFKDKLLKAIWSELTVDTHENIKQSMRFTFHDGKYYDITINGSRENEFSYLFDFLLDKDFSEVSSDDFMDSFIEYTHADCDHIWNENW